MRICFGTKQFNRNNGICLGCIDISECAKSNDVVFSKKMVKRYKKKIKQKKQERQE